MPTSEVVVRPRDVANRLVVAPHQRANVPRSYPAESFEWRGRVRRNVPGG